MKNNLLCNKSDDNMFIVKKIRLSEISDNRRAP